MRTLPQQTLREAKTLNKKSAIEALEVIPLGSEPRSQTSGIAGCLIDLLSLAICVDMLA